MTVGTIGLFFMILPAVYALSAPFSGYVSDKVSHVMAVRLHSIEFKKACKPQRQWNMQYIYILLNSSEK